MSKPLLSPATALAYAISAVDDEYSWTPVEAGRVLDDLMRDGYRLVPIRESTDGLEGQVMALRSLLNQCRGAAKALVQEAEAFDDSL